MFKEGLLILVVGMTSAFVFLYLMILVMRVMHKPITSLNHLLPDLEVRQPKRAPPVSEPDEDAKVALAIVAANRR